MANKPKTLRDEKTKVLEELEQKKKEKEEYEIKNAAKIRKQEKKKAKKIEKKKLEEGNVVNSETLFVRNIGYETTQAKFKEFMDKFGPVKYALLCKVPGSEKGENGELANKGTGFVQFKDQESAN